MEFPVILTKKSTNIYRKQNENNYSRRSVAGSFAFEFLHNTINAYLQSCLMNLYLLII